MNTKPLSYKDDLVSASRTELEASRLHWRTKLDQWAASSTSDVHAPVSEWHRNIRMINDQIHSRGGIVAENGKIA